MFKWQSREINQMYDVIVGAERRINEERKTG